MARGQPFPYMPLTDLGQALRDVGLAYLQGLRSPEELEKERVMALQAQLAIDQARQKIEAERQAQLARQGLASTLASAAPDPTLGNILRDAAMMSGDPAITAGFAAMPGAIGGNAAAMAPWFSLYTKKPLDPNDALTVRHQGEIAARNQQNELQRIYATIAAKTAGEEQLLRTKAALAQEAENRPLSDVELGALRHALGIDLPPGATAGTARMAMEMAGKAVPLEDVATLIGALGGQVPPAMADRAAEGAHVPTSLAQALLAQVGRAGVEAAKSEREMVSVAEAAFLRPDLAPGLREAGIERVSREFLKQATRQDVAALKARSAVEAARVKALGGVEPIKLGVLREILVGLGAKIDSTAWPENVDLPPQLVAKFFEAIRDGTPLDDATADRLALAFGLRSGTLRGLTEDAAIKAATGAAGAAAAAERNEINRFVAKIREDLGLSRLALYGRELDLREQKQLTDAELRRSELGLREQKQATDAELRRGELGLREQKQLDEGERWRSELGFKRDQADIKRSLEEQKIAIQRDLARLREQEIAARNELERLRVDNSAQAAEARAKAEQMRLEAEQKRLALMERRIELEDQRLELEGKKFVDRQQAADFLNEIGLDYNAASLPESVPVAQLFSTARAQMKRQSEQRAQDLRAQQSAEQLRLMEERVKQVERAQGLRAGQTLSRQGAANILREAGVPVDMEDLPESIKAGDVATLVRAQAALTRARAQMSANMATALPRPIVEKVLSKWGLTPEDLGEGAGKLTPQMMREVTRGLEAAYRAYDLTTTAQRFGVSGPILRVLYESAGLQPPENLDQAMKSGDLTALTALARLRREEARSERRATTPWSDVVGIAQSLGAQIDAQRFPPGHEVDVGMARTTLAAVLSSADREKEVDPDVVRRALIAIGGDPSAFVGQPLTVRQLTDIMGVLSRHMVQVERLDVAKAAVAARMADQHRLSPKDRLRMLGEVTRILRTTLQGVDGRRSPMADAILQNPEVVNGIADRALSRSLQDGRSLAGHIADILRNEIEFNRGWFGRNEVKLKDEQPPFDRVPAQAAPQVATQEVAPGGPASVLSSVPMANIPEAPKSKAELRALPEGAIVRDPITGMVFQKRGDRLMLVQGGQK
jgi:hypothetical protein